MSRPRYSAFSRLQLTLLLSASAAGLFSSGGANAEMAGEAPLENVLQSVGAEKNVSFVYDSRIVRHATVTPMDGAALSDGRLEKSLEEKGLRLKALNAELYVVQKAPAPPVASPPMSSPFEETAPPDVILVTARAQVASIDAHSPNIIAINQADLELFNVVNPADVINELPQTIASFTPASTILNGAVAGVSFPDLRGFGPERTHVLVNGRRRTLTPGGTSLRSGYDLNALAEPFLERIEVVGNAAGARLSSEAIGGALNFVTRKDVDGVEAGARYGVSEFGDAAETSAYVLAGAKNDDARIVVGVNVVSANGLKGGDRPWTDEPYGFAINGRRSGAIDAHFLPGFGGSLITPAGNLIGAVLNNGSVSGLPGPGRFTLTGDGGFEPYEGRLNQLYNWAQEQHFIAPVERVITMADGEMSLSPDVSLFSRISFAATRSKIELAPMPGSFGQGSDPLVGNALAINLDDPDVSPEIRSFFDDLFDGEADALVLERRFIENGNRKQRINRRYFDAITGFTIESGLAVFEASYRYGRSGVKDVRANLIDRARLNIAIDDDLCAATPGCAPAAFVSGSPSSAAAAFYEADPAARRIIVDEHEVFLTSKFKIKTGLAEDIKASISGEYRRASLKDRMLTSPANIIGVFDNQDPSGAVTHWTARAAADIPAYRARNGDGAVDLYLAGGLVASSLHGARFNKETSLVWTISEPLALYGQFFDGYRSPNIVELYDVPQKIDQLFTDPCDPANGLLFGNAAINCASSGPLGVGDDFRQLNFLARVGGFGDPDMEPEHVQSFGAGVKLGQMDLPFSAPGNISISAHWLRTHIDDVITGSTNPLEECYASPDFSEAGCGISPLTGEPLIVRDPETQQITDYDILLTNRGERHWEGVDLDATLNLKPERLGPVDRLWLNVNHSYVYKSYYRYEEFDILQEFASDINTPRHASLITLGVDAGPATLAFFINRRGKARSAPFNIEYAVTRAHTTVDGTFKYEFGDDASLLIGVKNIFDKEPPLSAQGGLGGVYPQYYDIIGRRFSIGVRAKL